MDDYEMPSGHWHNIEKVADYQPGGFLDVQLDQDLHSRYHILRKLGKGGFATVWLAYDNHDDQWVSVKILRANESLESKELAIHTHVKQALQLECLSSVGIVHLIDHFQHESVHGDVHQCLVFELLGPSIYFEFLQNWHCDIYPEHDEADTIFLMTLRLLEAITALHEAGYAWGDPSPSNMAFTFPETDQLSRQQVLDIVGRAEQVDSAELYGDQALEERVPDRLIYNSRFPDWPIDDYQQDFRILDLGNAFPIGERRTSHAQPYHLRPPEMTFDQEVGYETDSWGSGMMIYYFVFGRWPHNWILDEFDRIQAIINCIGPLPQRWQMKWDLKKKEQYSGRKSFREIAPGSVLDTDFAAADHCEDVKLLLPVIKGLLRWEPAQRDSPKHALESVVRICQNSQDEDLQSLVFD